ncbi:degenerin mec-10 [Patella vulgata]|uniref:degenerin mec-10 n=1 Tax=Patella vulgata TaxID=6465 RepID=UPI0021805A27|nr:degenerin mec-10 [Patella vulgata]
MSRSGLQFYNGRETDYIPPSDYNNPYHPGKQYGYNNYKSPARYEDPDGPYYNENRLNQPRSDEPAYSESGTANDKQPWSYRKICRRFAERTSMQGIPYIHASKTWYSKGAWTLIFLIGTGGMIFHLYYLFSIYLQYPKQTKVELGFDALPFPAVTFCSVNPMRKSMAKLASRELRDLLEEVKPENAQKLYQDDVEAALGEVAAGVGPLIRKKRFLDKLNVNRSSTRVEVEEREHFGEDDWERIGTKDEADEIYENFLSLFNAEPRHTRLKMGHEIDSMLIKCSFAGRSCYPENFTQIADSHFGNCYTLQTSLFKSRRSGPDQGLEVILFLQNHEFIRGITNGNGIQMLVHDRDVMPHPYDQGLAIASASESIVGLTLLRINRLGKPYATCQDVTAFQNLYGAKYTRASCQKFCEAILIMDNCNCTDPFKEEINLKIGNTRELPHECRSEKDTKCMVSTERRYEIGDLKCTCDDPCDETKYVKSVSARQWPSKSYADLLLDILCNKRGKAECANYEKGDDRSLAQNFVKLNIYFEDLNYQNITEEPDYQDSQFASDVGGTVGLWIGLSALSLVEVFQFIAEIINYTCCKRKSPRDQQKQNESKQNESEMKGFRNQNFKQ